MTTMSTLSAGTGTSRLRAGLALSAVLGLLNVAFLAVPTGGDQESPPVLVIVLSAVLGLTQVIRLAAEADVGVSGPAGLRPPGQAGASIRLDQLSAARAPPVGRHP